MDELNKFFKLLLVILAIRCSVASTVGYYTAAVYEHARLGDETPDTQVQTNLKWYERATILAKKQGADMILFPEYGLFPPVQRKDIKKHLEYIPNPRQTKANPCNESDLYLNSTILRTLSCMAKKNKIVVVANMGGKEYCANKPGCPKDGDLHMNANVAFDEYGTLLGRYYKEHLFFETAMMDSPRQKQDPVFRTNFGKFAMFICFDIIWKEMAITSRLPDIDAILFSTMWMNSFPFYMSTPWFQAWAMGNNATILASNLQIPRYLAAGSGIFRGKEGAIASTYNSDGISKLVVTPISKGRQNNLPPPQVTAIFENSTKPWKDQDDGKDLPPAYSYPILGEVNYILKKLNKTSDHVKVCNNSICCQLNYTASSMNENFYLGIFSGMHNSYDKYFWAEENCFLARCEDFNGTACSSFPTKSKTVFQKIYLTANFKSKIVYPWLVSSRIRLVPTDNWTYEVKENRPLIKYENNSGVPLLVAGLMGRDYDNDPLFIN